MRPTRGIAAVHWWWVWLWLEEAGGYWRGSEVFGWRGLSVFPWPGSLSQSYLGRASRAINFPSVSEMTFGGISMLSLGGVGSLLLPPPRPQICQRCQHCHVRAEGFVSKLSLKIPTLLLPWSLFNVPQALLHDRISPSLSHSFSSRVECIKAPAYKNTMEVHWFTWK